MTTHRPHPMHGQLEDGTTVADSDDAVLYDHCERCTELAASPATGLSSEYAARLWQRMVDVEKDDRRGYATSTEASAARVYYAIALFLERQTDIDPWHWPLRAREKIRGTVTAGQAASALRAGRDPCEAEHRHLATTYPCILEAGHDGDHEGIRREPPCPVCGGYDDHTTECSTPIGWFPDGERDQRFTFTDEETTNAS